MAFNFNTEIYVNDNWTQAMYALKEELKSASWNHLGSGDGLAALSTTSGNGNDVITSSNSGANGFNNSRAWIHLEDPGATRELVIQRSNVNDLGWRVKYSKGDGFSGGAAADTTPGGGADEGYIWGGGTDASPTFQGDVFQPLTNPNGMAHIMAEDTDAPYRFYMVGYLSGKSPTMFFGLDDSVSGLVESDHDPVFFWRANDDDAMDIQLYDGASIIGKGWVSSTSFEDQHGYRYTENINNPSRGIPNEIGRSEEGPDPFLPVLVGRDSTKTPPSGIKAISRMIYYLGPRRATGTTFNVTGAKSHVCFGYLVLPWDGTTAPTI